MKGVISAEVDGVEGRLLCVKIGTHVVHQAMEVILGIVAAANTGLIGNDDNAKAECPRCGDKWNNAIDITDVSGAGEIADLVVNDAIAVKEEGRSDRLGSWR